jgi:4-hydroxybenzoate polyprenyltransferase
MNSQPIKARAPMNGEPRTVVRVDLGQELATRDEYSLRDRIAGFLALIRPLFFILTPLNAASAAVLALRDYPPLTQCLLGFFTVAFAGCAINVFNDYIDRERDKAIWPSRPIPSGRVNPNEALFMVIVAFAASLSMAWFFFNPTTFFILLTAVILGALYSAYFRDRFGYLSLPPIVGLIYLGGWAAFSPETLFSTLLPWYLYLLGVVWQTAHIMIYYPLHIIYADTEPKTEAPPALFFRPSPQTAIKIGVAFTCLTLLLSLLLPLLAPLNGLYLALIIAVGIYALTSGLRLQKDALNKDKGLKAFTSLSIFRLVISATILLVVFLSQV